MGRLADADELMGLSEVTAFIGLSDGRISQLLRDDPTFPRPVTCILAGRLWVRSDIQAWEVNRVKGKPGRPSLKIKAMEEAVLKETEPT